jgi:hypothetical protein
MTIMNKFISVQLGLYSNLKYSTIPSLARYFSGHDPQIFREAKLRNLGKPEIHKARKLHEPGRRKARKLDEPGSRKARRL